MTIWDDSKPLPGAIPGEDPAGSPGDDAAADQPIGFRDDEDQTPGEDRPAPAAPATGVHDPAVGRRSMDRREVEWRRLQRGYAYHPHVRVTPLEGWPPEQYQVDYRLQTIEVDENGQLQYRSTSSVHIWLPPGFPHEPPLVRPMSAVFHPNVTMEAIDITAFWLSSASTLLEVVRGVGLMLAYQFYELDLAANPMAVEWLLGNPTAAPTDPEASLEVDAGGTPAARIAASGPRTLEQGRDQLKQLVEALAGESALDVDQLKGQLAWQRHALDLFFTEGVPQELGREARELDLLAREMPESLPAWEAIRSSRRSAAAAVRLAGEMGAVEKLLRLALRSVEEMRAAHVEQDAAEALRHLPTLADMEDSASNLESLLERAEAVLKEAPRASVRIGPAANQRKFTPLLQQRLDGEIERARVRAGEVNPKLSEAAASLAPVVAQGRQRLAGLRKLVDWRSYLDLSARGGELAQRVRAWGPAGIAAFVIANESGQFGPFELEQKLSLGQASVIVRNPGGMLIEVLEGETGERLGRGEEGNVTVSIADPESGDSFPMRFDLQGNCEEAAVQLDYIMRETANALTQVARPRDGGEAGSWVAELSALLVAPEQWQRVVAEYEAAQTTWGELHDELVAVGEFKARLATFRVLERARTAAPEQSAGLAEAKKELAAVEARLGAIAAASNTDLETGRMQIPHRYAKEYPDQLRKREEVKQRIASVQKRRAKLVEEVRRRLADPRELGAAWLPELSAMGVRPDAWEDLAVQMADERIDEMVTELEGVLRVELRERD